MLWENNCGNLTEFLDDSNYKKICNNGIVENYPQLNIILNPNNPAKIVITPQTVKMMVSDIVPNVSSIEKSTRVSVVFSISFVDELRFDITTKYDGNAINKSIAVIGITIAFATFCSQLIISYRTTLYNFFLWGKPDKIEDTFCSHKSVFLQESPIQFISVFYVCKFLNGGQTFTKLPLPLLDSLCFHQKQ